MSTRRSPGVSKVVTYPFACFSVMLQRCTGARIEGICIIDNEGWAVRTNGCSDVVIDDVKVIGPADLGRDGVDICNCRDVVVNDCFVRSNDDSLICYSFRGDDGQATRNTFTNCVLWSDGWRSIRVTNGCADNSINDVLFKNIDIIHHLDATHPVVGITANGDATIENVRFEDIRVEDTEKGTNPVDICAGPGYPNDKDWDGRGHIKNIVFKNFGFFSESVATVWIESLLDLE